MHSMPLRKSAGGNFLSLTHLHSRMCIRTYISNFNNKSKKARKQKKAKESKEEKTISVEMLCVL